MRKPMRSLAAIFVVTVAVLIALLTGFCVAQSSPGQNAVCTSSSGCSTTIGTSAFIDASVLFQNDICTTIYNILQPSTYSASVIDARGITGAVALTCPANTSPWLKGGTSLNKPSTILLPATGGGNNFTPIVIPTGWVLPANTHLIGQGDNLSSGTVIQASSSFSGTEDMIQFGTSTCVATGCPAVSVEKLILDGQGRKSGGNYINGIVNESSQLAYVDHVSLYQILGTGLSLSGGASNSGPYTNINFDTGGHAGVGGTVCASINGLTNTRGIRGLNCNSRSADANVAVQLDSPSNLIKDITIIGFNDGILVGANGPAQSNVLVNIIGDTVPSGLNPIRAIHISSNKTNGVSNATDLSILGVGNDAPSGTYTIWDDLTGPTISDAYVGLYVIGESANNGYARFTTSPGHPTWEVGTLAPSTSASCAQGSLYSCTGGTLGSSNCLSGSKAFALWGCPTGTGWVGIQ